ncbi:MAG: helix-turn-helix transcriptional regulator [Bradymonadales bacterium]
MSVAENVKFLRLSNSWSIDDFAQRMELSVADCQAIESGVRVISSAEINRMCRIFDVSIDELFSERGNYDDDEGSVLMPLDDLQTLLGKMRDQ